MSVNISIKAEYNCKQTFVKGKCKLKFTNIKGNLVMQLSLKPHYYEKRRKTLLQNIHLCS